MDRQWSNHQRDSRCVREKIQMAYERVDRGAVTGLHNRTLQKVLDYFHTTMQFYKRRRTEKVQLLS